MSGNKIYHWKDDEMYIYGTTIRLYQKRPQWKILKIENLILGANFENFNLKILRNILSCACSHVATYVTRTR